MQACGGVGEAGGGGVGWGEGGKAFDRVSWGATEAW